MDEQQLNQEGRELWNQKAEFWDALHGETGNDFHRHLVEPPILRLLDLQPGERILDVGCGTGVLTRRLAQLGGQVTAIDFSEGMLERARTYGGAIDYRVADATDEAALVTMGKFDAIVCSMVIMDIPRIAPMFRAVRQMLTTNGRFVFATMHPAFNSNNPVFFVERGDSDGELFTHYGVKIFAYLDMPPVKGVGAPGEPNPHYYYHRPLHELLGTAFDAGLVMDGLEETTFPRPESDDRRLGLDKMWQIPLVLAGRLRVRL